jgi:hypothetical protein
VYPRLGAVGDRNFKISSGHGVPQVPGGLAGTIFATFAGVSEALWRAFSGRDYTFGKLRFQGFARKR